MTLSMGDRFGLLSCIDTCRFAASAIRERQLDVEQLARWCADVCEAYASRPRLTLVAWSEVYQACVECSRRCTELSEAGPSG